MGDFSLLATVGGVVLLMIFLVVLAVFSLGFSMVYKIWSEMGF
jgi:hypothetical protein